MHDLSRKHYIPITRKALKEALFTSDFITSEVRIEFFNLWRMVEAYFQHKQFQQCEKLRLLYYPLDPEIADDEALGTTEYKVAYRRFLREFEPLIEQANFITLASNHLPSNTTKETESGLLIYSPDSLYSNLKFFCRGESEERRIRTRFFGIKREEITQPVYETVIMIAAIKSESEFDSKKQIKNLRENNIHPGSVFIKLYRNVNHSFLKALLPEVRLKFDARNKLALGIPALIGGIPLIFKILPTLAVLSILIGIQVPFLAESQRGDTDQIIAALAGAFAAGGFVSHQFLKFQRHSLKYMSKIKNELFYKNSSNNAGLFDYLALLANEQEIKECMLAYFFLQFNPDQTEASLDAEIEAWLAMTFNKNIDFECDDAVRKLIELNLAVVSESRIRVRPIREVVNTMKEHIVLEFLKPEMLSDVHYIH